MPVDTAYNYSNSLLPQHRQGYFLDVAPVFLSDIKRKAHKKKLHHFPFHHIEALQEKVFTYGSEVIQDFDIMSDSLVDQANLQELKKLLSEHGYSDEEIQDFIEKLGYSHE